ncbi:pyridoxamine 5'-phosphate oxidase family protein [Paenarthrobacter ureafaciens]|uniref:pyridoxamine 5'-phosphate oxidase family protein n=1 Tax=Paenarthrobacter TaxID=1742992 RepID=UPI00223034DB|nr:pyridoxamine 5'-phosphate oxidase family protein [Paenarthrobacter sp. PAE-2]MCW3766637.1 pyridoxamine 5'-phosphate oxidase family protein [Paenarthrobacter sp. PAE-2]
MESTPHTAIERLDPEECWALLGQTNVGRLAVLVEGHPDIFPVNYVLDGQGIVFRTGAGTKYWSAMKAPTALEIDGFEAGASKAWSVVARGRAAVILERHELAEAEALDLEPWQAGSKNHYVRIIPESITGRRFTTTRPDIWKAPLNDARRESFR